MDVSDSPAPRNDSGDAQEAEAVGLDDKEEFHLSVARGEHAQLRLDAVNDGRQCRERGVPHTLERWQVDELGCAKYRVGNT